MSECDDYRELLSGMLDGELTSEEASTITKHLNRCAHCRQEYETLRQDATRLDTLSIAEPQDEAVAKFWRMPYNRLARSAGLILAIGGYVLFLVYGFVTFLFDDEEGFLGKFALSGMIIGGLIILSIVAAERIISYQTDPYKEIDR
jgi:predicted anti-sigma-YlaC factor YlaD